MSIDWKQYSNETNGAEKPEEGVVFVLLLFEGMIAYFCRKTLGGEQRRRIIQSSWRSKGIVTLLVRK